MKTNTKPLDAMANAVRKFIKMNPGKDKDQVRELFVTMCEELPPGGKGWRGTNMPGEAAFDMFFDTCWRLELRCN